MLDKTNIPPSPASSKARVYDAGYKQIRAGTGYPLIVNDKPRSPPIRSAVTAADGM
jgi:hypothetical protein